MGDYQSNLATFQNLCVVAFADGQLHPEEQEMLLETATAMGLDPSDVEAMLDQAAQLELIIPRDKHDREQQLRMAVFMMICDGDINPQEYATCHRLAQALEIPAGFVDKIIDFFLTKQREKITHLGMFQNLYLVAIADHKIVEREQDFLLEVSQHLGLSEEELAAIIAQEEDLEFVIPDDEEERYYTLRNLVYMMLIDGEIAPEEYELCITYAERVGWGQPEVEQIIREYERIQAERQAQQGEVDQYNIDLYLDVFQELEAINMAVFELAQAAANAIRYHNYQVFIGQSDRENRTFYEFLWLAKVRGTTLDPEMWQFLPSLLYLVEHHGNFKALRDHMLRIEQEKGGSRIPLNDMSLDEVKQELEELFR